MRPLKPLLMVGLALAVAGPVQGQNVTFSGQVRPRYESRDLAGMSRDGATSMRVRAALRAAVDPGLTVFIQGQDVRLWGSETNTLGDFNADNFDIHQAYLQYTGKKLDWLTTTVGRMETALGGQRLIGSVGWAQQGRSFDGVRLDAAGERVKLSLIGYTLADASAPTHAQDMELFGAYATVARTGPGALDLYWLHERGDGSGTSTRQSTLGARYVFTRDGLTGRFEGSAQTGRRAGFDVAAFMFGGRLGGTFNDGKVDLTLWYDYLSGDDDPTDDELGVFSTLYATNHKFYGYADLFLDIPGHTAGLGLQDAAVKLSLKPSPTVTLGTDLHFFSAAEEGPLSVGRFAEEIDFTLTRQYSPNLAVTTGASFVFQVDGLERIGRLDRNLRWIYVMFDARF